MEEATKRSSRNNWARQEMQLRDIRTNWEKCEKQQ
jgi:hypothetical protein